MAIKTPLWQHALVLLDQVLERPGYYLTTVVQWDAPWAKVTLRHSTDNRDRRVAVVAHHDWRTAARNAMEDLVVSLRLRNRDGKWYLRAQLREEDRPKGPDVPSFLRGAIHEAFPFAYPTSMSFGLDAHGRRVPVFVSWRLNPETYEAHHFESYELPSLVEDP